MVKLWNFHLCASAIFAAMIAGAPLRAELVKPKPLAVENQQHILNDKFQTLYTVKAIPIPVKTAFAVSIKGMKLTGPVDFALPQFIADPGQRFNATDVIEPNLPSRRLIFAAVSQDYCLVTYENGGLGYNHKVALYRFKGNNANLLWCGYVLGASQTLADVRVAIGAKKYQDSETL